MDSKALLKTLGARIDPSLAGVAYRLARKVPWVRRQVEAQLDELLAGIEQSAKPYRDRFARHHRLPVQGLSRESILQDMRSLVDEEAGIWREGKVSGAVYHGDPEHVDFLNQVYALNSQSNPLHADIWPSANKYEAEIVAMTASMLSGDSREASTLCGCVSSGGTESILLAMKAYRDRARVQRRITRPEMVLPVTAHAAFDKACRYFCIKPIHVDIDAKCRAQVREVKKAINRRTIVVVGSAPSFPHGAIDPIAELSELARARGVGFHTDACLGGFVLPWAERLGRAVPAFDFRLPGVTSMSADTHKYGYAAKGTSVVLYRSPELRRFQYFTTTDWPGGLYFSPTFAGSRPGALSAACWASLLSHGEQGYLDATRRVLEAADCIKQGVASIPELRLMGDPLWVIAFASDELDIYRVMDAMSARGWSLNGLHKPACVHIAVTLRHTAPGVAQRFVDDLGEAVAQVKSEPASEDGMAPVYGMAATLPVRSLVGDLLERYMDVLYRV